MHGPNFHLVGQPNAFLAQGGACEPVETPAEGTPLARWVGVGGMGAIAGRC
jgi:hypothetical protein